MTLVHLDVNVDSKTIDALLDALEKGAFCNCIVGQQEMRLFKDISHDPNCIGCVKISEVFYEFHGQWGKDR